jgi:hypothetical protein
MPDIPAYAFRREVHLNPISQTQPLIEELSRLERHQFVQKGWGTPEAPDRDELHQFVQKGWGSPETPSVSELHQFVQKGWGSPESPARSESVTISQS